MKAENYLSRGVSPTKDDVHAAIKKQDKGIFPGAFCKIIEDIAGDENYCSIIHADGAGTKSVIAYLYYKETGNAEIFKGISQDSLVMNIDDMMCAGAVDNFVVSNTIGRNAHRINGEILKNLIDGYSSFIDELKKHGINISMSGGETADIGDLVSTVVVDSTVFARLRKKDVLDCKNICPGDAIVALASYGKAVYEKEYNSGIASNGLTAARHILLSAEYKKFTETYSPTIDSDKVFSGKYLLSDKLPGSSQTIGQALLSPTRSYLPAVKKILEKEKSSIHALIHCTGGGLAKSKNFADGIKYVKDNLFDMPPIFKTIRETGNVPLNEMFQIFNCGHRLEIYCKADSAADIIAISEEYGIEAKVIGHTEKSQSGKNEVIIKYKNETFSY